MKENYTRTNIVLNDELVKRGLEVTQLTTRRELIDYALRELLRHAKQRKILELKGQVKWEGDLDEMRSGRNL